MSRDGDWAALITTTVASILWVPLGASNTRLYRRDDRDRSSQAC